MARTRYERGRDVEYAAQEKLRVVGWFAQRAPSSKGPADVVAIRGMSLRGLGTSSVYPEVLFVNCKRTITDCGPDDWNNTLFAAQAVGATPLVAGRFPGVRGVRFMRMLGPKVPGRTTAPQPWEPFDIGGES